MSQLSQLFPKQIALAYGCLDRVVIRGYYPALQREDNIIHFFQDVVGLPVVDSGALASRTESYRQWLDAYMCSGTPSSALRHPRVRVRKTWCSPTTSAWGNRRASPAS